MPCAPFLSFTHDTAGNDSEALRAGRKISKANAHLFPLTPGVSIGAARGIVLAWIISGRRQFVRNPNSAKDITQQIALSVANPLPSRIFTTFVGPFFCPFGNLSDQQAKGISPRRAILPPRAVPTDDAQTSFSHPRGMRVGPWNLTCLSSDKLRMMSVPPSGDIDPPAEPDFALPLRVFDELP
jgi:hypothetical protein